MADISNFFIKVDVEYPDGRVAEGYDSFNFDKDETYFAENTDCDDVCLYMSKKSADAMLARVRLELRLMKSAGCLKKGRARLEKAGPGIGFEQLAKFCKNGACRYYVALCM